MLYVAEYITPRIAADDGVVRWDTYARSEIQVGDTQRAYPEKDPMLRSQSNDPYRNPAAMLKQQPTETEERPRRTESTTKVERLESGGDVKQQPTETEERPRRTASTTKVGTSDPAAMLSKSQRRSRADDERRQQRTPKQKGKSFTAQHAVKV